MLTRTVLSTKLASLQVAMFHLIQDRQQIPQGVLFAQRSLLEITEP